jgi:serine O-acetyltransferase
VNSSMRTYDKDDSVSSSSSLTPVESYNITGRALSFQEMVRRDLSRHYGVYSRRLLWRAILFKKTFTPVFSMRLYQHVTRQGGLTAALATPWLKMFHRWACARLSIELPPVTSIGAGFRIIHGFGLVVNANAIIGEDVTVFQGVTIGQKDVVREDGRRTHHARIGNKVMLGPYVQVLGTTVGDGATAAPLTVIYENVPSRSVVAGNPMRILRQDAVPDVRYGDVEGSPRDA